MIDFLKRIFQYQKERFPIGQFFWFSFFLGTVSALIAQIGTASVDTLGVWMTVFALFLFLLQLRVFDEFKDAKHDQEFYPNRPVPRGLVSLDELKWIGILVLVVECIIAYWVGGDSLLIFVILFGYSLLMFYEFFVEEWLSKHFGWYIFSHEIALIPLFLYLFSLSGIGLDQIGTNQVLGIVGLSCLFFGMEVARKSRTVEDERFGKDTYSYHYGMKGASWLLWVVSMIGFLSFVGIIWNLGSYFGVLVLSLVFGYYSWSIYRFSQSQITGKELFKISILYFVVTSILCLIFLYMSFYGF